MGIFDRLRPKNEVVNPVTVERSKRSILSRLNPQNLDRTVQQIQDWRDGLEWWEDVHAPDRQYLIEIYKDIELDAQVTAQIKKAEKAILSNKFQFVNQDGEEVESSLRLTNSNWFDSLVCAFIGAEMQGFSALQLIKDKDTYIADLIPREKVQPEKGFIRMNLGDPNGLPMYDKPYSDVLIYIGDRYDKGLFASLAPSYIYKKNAFNLWSSYQQKFGVPPVIAKADLTQEKEISTLEKMLENLGSNSWGILDLDTEVEGLNLQNTDGYLTFRNMIDLTDAQISKVISGETMTSDDGSSQAQASVHENIAERAARARLDRFLAVFNSQVIPFLVRDGFIAEGITLSTLEVEDVNELLDQVTKINAAGYKVEPDWLSEKTGIPLAELPPQPIENRYGAK